MNQSKNFIATKGYAQPYARFLGLVGLSLALLQWTNPVLAAQVAGSVINLSGPLMAQRADGSIRVLSQKSEVEEGDTLISEKGTYARIKFIDNSEVTLRPNTQFKITNFAFDEARPQEDNAVFSLIKGGLRSITGLLGKRSKERYGLNTPTATIGIRGTTFIAQYISPDEVQPTEDQAAYTAASVAWLSDGERLAFGMSDTRTDYGPAVTVQPLPLLAQNAPGQGGGLAPGLYVHVIDGLIQLSNRGGVQQFAAGQFGFTGSVVQPPVIVPKNPGIQFNPPPAFQSSSGPQSNSNASKPKTVDCEVR
jgi:hypothetical protein